MDMALRLGLRLGLRLALGSRLLTSSIAQYPVSYAFRIGIRKLTFTLLRRIRKDMLPVKYTDNGRIQRLNTTIQMQYHNTQKRANKQLIT